MRGCSISISKRRTRSAASCKARISVRRLMRLSLSVMMGRSNPMLSNPSPADRREPKGGQLPPTRDGERQLLAQCARRDTRLRPQVHKDAHILRREILHRLSRRQTEARRAEQFACWRPDLAARLKLTQAKRQSREHDAAALKAPDSPFLGRHRLFSGQALQRENTGAGREYRQLRPLLPHDGGPAISDAAAGELFRSKQIE